MLGDVFILRKRRGEHIQKRTGILDTFWIDPLEGLRVPGLVIQPTMKLNDAALFNGRRHHVIPASSDPPNLSTTLRNQATFFNGNCN